MSDYHAVLDGKKVRVVNDVMVWAKWFESADRSVAKSMFDNVKVSTVFLGCNHGFSEDLDLWFETMVFGGILDGEQDRYSTWEEAEMGHKIMCQRVAEEIKREVDEDS